MESDNKMIQTQAKNRLINNDRWYRHEFLL